MYRGRLRTPTSTATATARTTAGTQTNGQTNRWTDGQILGLIAAHMIGCDTKCSATATASISFLQRIRDVKAM